MCRELLEEVPKHLVKVWDNFSGLCLTLTPPSVRRNRKKESFFFFHVEEVKSHMGIEKGT